MREYNVTINVYNRFPMMFKESHTFAISSDSTMNARTRAKKICKELFPSGEYQLDLSILEQEEDGPFEIGPSIWVRYL